MEMNGHEWTYLYCLQTFNAEVQFLRGHCWSHITKSC
ncbi:hypothetical protein EFL45_08415 [Weissella confusa]|nr:hypothetical protein [Weissella confusa]